MCKRLIASLVCLTFSFSNLQYAQAQDFSINQLPVPGTMVGQSAPFVPLALKGLIVNPQKPLEFQFIVDTGESFPKSMSSSNVNSKLSSPNVFVGDPQQEQLKQQANQLVKYFLAGLTIPEGDLWVNLSPYEKNRMVPQVLGQTDLGRDLLAQDYILKQLTASLIYPEKDLGKEFWSRVYAKAQQQFGTTNVPVNTFNKVWILPDQAQVFENNNAAYVTKSTLKVMLDEDYLAFEKNQRQPGDMFNKEQQKNVSPSRLPSDAGLTTKAPQGNNRLTSTIGSQIVRQIILPEIEKEVNTGKNFAPLRQIYQALILAKWYKETIQNGLLDALYTNRNKVAGVNLADPAVKEQIYNRYLQAYKKGAFNYIKEDPTPDGQVVPRKYFSGGTYFGGYIVHRDGTMSAVKSDGAMIITVVLAAAGLAAVVVGALKGGSKGKNASKQKQTPDTAMIGMLEDTGGASYSDQKVSLKSILASRFDKFDLEIDTSGRVLIDRQEIDHLGYRGRVYYYEGIVFIADRGESMFGRGPDRGVFYAVIDNGRVLKLKAEDIAPAIQENLDAFLDVDTYTDSVGVYNLTITGNNMTLTLFTRRIGRKDVTIDFNKLLNSLKAKYTESTDQTMSHTPTPIQQPPDAAMLEAETLLKDKRIIIQADDGEKFEFELANGYTDHYGNEHENYFSIYAHGSKVFPKSKFLGIPDEILKELMRTNFHTTTPIMEQVSLTEITILPGWDLTRETIIKEVKQIIQKTTKGDFDKVWGILQPMMEFSNKGFGRIHVKGFFIDLSFQSAESMVYKDVAFESKGRATGYRGVGRTLLALAMGVSKLKGFHSFTAEVTDPSVVDFYKKLGFEESKFVKKIYSFNLQTQPLPIIKIEKIADQAMRSEEADRIVARIEQMGGYQSEYSDYIPLEYVYYNQMEYVIFREYNLATYQVGDTIPDSAMLHPQAPKQTPDAAMYGNVGLSSLQKPLNLKMNPDTATVNEVVQEFEKHQLFTAGLSEADRAMLNEILQFATNHPFYLSSVAVGGSIGLLSRLNEEANEYAKEVSLFPLIFPILGSLCAVYPLFWVFMIKEPISGHLPYPITFADFYLVPMLFGASMYLSSAVNSVWFNKIRIEIWTRAGNVNKILTMLDNEDESVRQAAEQALAELMASKEQMINGYIAVLSSNRGNSEATRNAKAALKDLGVNLAMLHPQEQTLDAAMLGKIAKIKYWQIKGTGDKILPMLSDGDRHVSFAAAKALFDLGYRGREVLLRLDVSKKLISEQPPGAWGRLLSFENEAYRYALQGYDFNVVFKPEQNHWVVAKPNLLFDQVEVIDSPEVLRIERGDKLDQAMLQKPEITKKPEDLGGIDLNQINVNHTGKTVSVQFDPAQLNALMQGGFEGFTPVIINMTRISSPFQLLGINPAKEQVLVKV